MVNTSARPITVDGVRLDTLAWNVTAIRRAVAARRNQDVEIPGRDGVAPSLNDTLEPATYGLDMFVRGSDADGLVPGGDSLTLFRNNLDELVHLFGKRHALLDLREQVDAGGTQRRAWAKVQDVIAPEANTIGTVATFAVGMVLPYGMWEDVNTSDWTGTGGVVTSLTGSTERITDAVVAITGNGGTPTLTDNATGAYVSLATPLTSGQVWRVNVGTWSSRSGSLTVGSADTTGTDRTADTRYGGPVGLAGSYLTLAPVRSGSSRQVSVTLTGAASVTIRARRKYAL